MLRLFAMVLISVMFMLVKLAAAEGVTIVEAVFWRQLAGLPIIIGWLWSTGKLVQVRTNRPLGHALRMILGLTAMTLNYLTMTLLPLAEATSIGFIVPIAATVLAAIFLKESVGLHRWAAVAAGFVGVLIVVQPFSGSFSSIGVTVAVGGGLLTAVAVIYIRQLTYSEQPTTIVFWFGLSSLVPLGLAMPFFAGSHDILGWTYIIAIAVTGTISQLAMTVGFRYAPVSVLMPMDYTALIWAALLGWFVLGDLPHLATWVGTPIIIAAGLFIVWREHKLSRTPTPVAATAVD